MADEATPATPEAQDNPPFTDPTEDPEAAKAAAEAEEAKQKAAQKDSDKAAKAANKDSGKLETSDVQKAAAEAQAQQDALVRGATWQVGQVPYQSLSQKDANAAILEFLDSYPNGGRYDPIGGHVRNIIENIK